MQVARRKLLAAGLLAVAAPGDALGKGKSAVSSGQADYVPELAGDGDRYQAAGSLALQRSVEDRLRDYASVLDYVPVHLHADIRGGRSTADISRYVQNAVDEVGVVYFPAGRYVFNVAFSKDNRGLVGQAVGRQSLDGEWEAGTVFWPADRKLPLIKCDPMAAGRIVNFITLRDFLAFGFNDGPFLQTNGDGPTRRTDYVEISNVFVQRFGHGFDIRGGGLDWRITGTHITTCLNDGVHIDTGNSACNGWMWTKCSFTRNGRHGWYGRKTDIAVEVSYAHTFSACGSEYNGQDLTEPVSRGWYFYNFDMVKFDNCTGETDRVGGDVIDIEFAGTTARNIRIDNFQSVGSDRAIKFGATLQHGWVSNVRAVLRSGMTAIEVVSGSSAPGPEPKIVVDRNSVRGGNTTITFGDGGRYDAMYADGTGPADVFNLDAGWSSGVDAIIDMRNKTRILMLAATAARVYGATFTNMQVGGEYDIEVNGAEPVVLPAALMQSGGSYSIPVNKSVRFRNGGFPYTDGKLRPLYVSP